MSEAGIRDEATPPVAAARRAFGARLAGALRLDAPSYDEIARDPAAIAQAAAVAAVVAALEGAALLPSEGAGNALERGVSVAVLWLVTSGLVWGVGRWFGYEARFGGVLAALGFATSLRLPMALWVIPVEMLRIAVTLLSTALLLGGYATAARAALAVPIGRAAFVVGAALAIEIFLLLVWRSIAGAA
jgi:hypothetical protein